MAAITALEAIEMLRILGLTARVEGEKLFVSPADLIDDDVAWLIRKHRDAIIAELEIDAPAWAWVVRVDDGTAKEIYRHPPATRAVIMESYPDAVSAERLPECDWPHDPTKLETENG